MSDLNPRQEKFCQAYVRLGVGKDACIEAGYSEHTARAGSQQLLKNPKIIARIEEIKSKVAVKYDITRDNLLEKYLDLYNAHFEDNPSVSKGCIDSIAKMCGLNEPDKVDVTSQGDSIMVHIEKTYINKSED